MKKFLLVIGALVLIAAIFGSGGENQSNLTSSSRNAEPTASPTKFTTWYDEAYQKNWIKGGNTEYYIFEFDSNVFVLTYKSKYGTHYGTFAILEDGDIQLNEKSNDSFITPYRFRRKNGRLYWVDRTTGEEDGTSYPQCSLEEAVKYIK